MPYKGRKRIGGAGVWIILILLLVAGVGAGFYYKISQEMNQVISEMEPELVDVEVSSYTMIPPSVDLVFYNRINNPSNFEFKLDIEIEIFFGDVYITSYTTHGQTLYPRSSSNIEFDMKLSSSIVAQLLMNLDKLTQNSRYTQHGRIILTYDLLGVFPIERTYTF
jgi:hypothetical protein